MSSWIVITCALLSLVAPVAAVLLTVSEPFPGSALAWYFRIRPWETWRHHAVYRRLGVRHFKRGLMFYYDVVFLWVQRSVGVRLFGQPQFTPEAWRRVNGQHLFLRSASQQELGAACRRTRRFELIHLFIGLPLLPIILVFLGTRHPLAAGILSGAIALTNVCPIFMQRYNRSRLQEILRANRCQPDGAVNESRPFASEADRTSPAAGSRH